jgi:hypothetical protein
MKSGFSPHTLHTALIRGSQVLEHLRDYSGFEVKNVEPTPVSHDGKDEGWKREVRFSTQLILTGFPSTKTETITTRVCS